MVDLKAKAAKSGVHFVRDLVQELDGHDFWKNLGLNICDSVDKTIEEQQVSKNLKKRFNTVMPEKVQTVQRPEQPALTADDVEEETPNGVQYEEEQDETPRKGF